MQIRRTYITHIVNNSYRKVVGEPLVLEFYLWAFNHLTHESQCIHESKHMPGEIS